MSSGGHGATFAAVSFSPQVKEVAEAFRGAASDAASLVKADRIGKVFAAREREGAPADSRPVVGR